MSSSTTVIDLSKDGGVVKTILKEGNAAAGHPSAGDSVRVHYVGRLKEGGKQFDSSRDRGEPFTFGLGKGEVIKGWDVGVASMTRGEVADLECRADYAYGAGGQPPSIPENATLVFNVELLGWEGEDISPDRDGTITKSTIVKGEKYNCPSEYAPVTAHVVGKFEGRVFYDEEVTFILGEGSEHKLPEGVDRALRRVDKGEKCQVVLRGSRFTYGSSPPAEFNLPPNAELVFTLFLKDFEKVKSSWELLDGEKLDAAQTLKERGTAFLAQGKLSLALQKYGAIVTMLEHTQPTDDEFKAKFEAMLVAAFLNSALVNLKMNETAECVKHCDKVLEKQANNVKALYRKAQAFEQRKDFDEAIDVYKKVIELDAQNKAALQQIAVCKHNIGAIREKERKRFAGMFDKLAAASATPADSKAADAQSANGDS